MEKIGVEKEIDKLGRILIPKQIRKSLGLNINSTVELIVTNEGLLIRTPQYKTVKIEADS